MAGRREAFALAPVREVDPSIQSLRGRRNSGDQVASYIRRLIFTGELRQGDRIPQDGIAAELGVSRIPVREAIIALDREGWITIEPHRGAFVHGLDETSVRDHYDLLGLFYGLTARRATERATEEEIGLLAESQRALTKARDVREVSARNDAFFRQVFTMARSPRLSAVGRVMTGLVPGDFFELVPGASDVARRGASAITRAVRARDADRAAQEFSRMLARHGDAVVALLSTRSVIRPATIVH